MTPNDIKLNLLKRIENLEKSLSMLDPLVRSMTEVLGQLATKIAETPGMLDLLLKGKNDPS